MKDSEARLHYQKIAASRAARKRLSEQQWAEMLRTGVVTLHQYLNTPR